MRLEKISLKQVHVFGFMVFAIFLGVSFTRINNFAMDEKIYHYPNVINFYTHGLGAIFNQEYSAANTPLPYMLVAVLSKIFGATLGLARIITAIVSLFTFFAASTLLTRFTNKPYRSLILLFYPYFFLNSFIFYVINFGLLFGCLALISWFRSYEKPGWWNALLTGILLSLSVLCQQFYLMLAAGLLISQFLRCFDTVAGRSKSGSFLDLILMGVPLLLPAYIFYRWHGLVPPTFQVHTIAFYPTTITALLFVTGLFFGISLANRERSISKMTLVAGGVLSVLGFIFFMPHYADLNGPRVFNGITAHVLNTVQSYSYPVFAVITISLCVTGFLVYSRLLAGYSEKSRQQKDLYLIAGLLIFAYCMNTIIGERHLLALFFILFFLIIPELDVKFFNIYLLFMTLLGLAYFFYWIFIKFN